MFQSQMNKKKREIWEVEVDLKKLWHNFLDTRSEDGFGFLRPGLKTGVERDIFWSEIGSGFGKPGGTPQPRIPRNTPPGGGGRALFSPPQSRRQKEAFLSGCQRTYLRTRSDCLNKLGE